MEVGMPLPIGQHPRSGVEQANDGVAGDRDLPADRVAGPEEPLRLSLRLGRIGLVGHLPAGFSLCVYEWPGVDDVVLPGRRSIHIEWKQVLELQGTRGVGEVEALIGLHASREPCRKEVPGEEIALGFYSGLKVVKCERLFR